MPTFGSAQLKLLERLCNAIAISGDESEVRKIVLEEIKPYAEDVRVDALGNVLATRHGRGQSGKRMRVMLDAHMDDVGFMFVAFNGWSFYRFEVVTDMDVPYLVGKQVQVGQDKPPGVIGGKQIHLLSSDERTRKVTLDGLRIHLGPAGKAKVSYRAAFSP